MSAKMNHEELVELLQEGKIGFLRFVMVQCGGRPRADMESAPTAFPL